MEQAVSVWCRRRREASQQRRCDAKSGVGGACPSRMMQFLLCTWRRALAAQQHGDEVAAATPTNTAAPESLKLIEEPMRTATLEAWNAGQRVYTCAELEVAFARPPPIQQQQQQQQQQQNEKEEENNNVAEERRAFAAMRAWMHVARRWTRCSSSDRPLRVCMVWTDLCKTRRSTDGRGAEQANGGLAFGCGRAELVVYRREEWWKVFLHETIHSLGLDSRRRISSEESSEPAWFEAFTECWARLWYIAWTAVVRHRAPAAQERAFRQLLDESQQFGWAQAARWNAGEGGGVDNTEFEEHTAGRMYFTAATALLCNLGALQRFTVAAHIMRPRLQQGSSNATTTAADMDDLAELIRAAVRSPTAARLRREVRLRPPLPLNPPNSMRMTHLDASPEKVVATTAGGGTQRRRSRLSQKTTTRSSPHRRSSTTTTTWGARAPAGPGTWRQ